MNPLSFSHQISLRLDQVIVEVAAQFGLPANQIQSIEQENSIALQVHNLPDVLLSVSDDRLWIWSLLPIHDENQLLSHAAEVLAILIDPVEGVETGQLTLGNGENGYELKALINLEQLQHDHGLKPALLGFTTQLYKISQTLQIIGA
ncbi:hypothetical protein HA052_03945 [Chromobacterium haemolyticum]|uniref:Uncharacterized protein n=1 Tax=Chromobacterium fluminis TaxID=3044269 RepID=A0ABX0KXS5_9NEIS|nr:hypothetical protein [Chromobacterium haemolyticum]NHR04342.1 hypothetical protein [Chromobacterium haemolyticum]